MEELSSLKGARILVTGHTGFKGSWLSLWLSRLGSKVFGFSLPPETEPNNYTVSSVKDAIHGEIFEDIQNLNALKSVVEQFRPEFIFHLAAQPLVRRSYQQPIETFQTNVIGSLNVLESVRASGRPCCLIMVTSDKCYENTGQVWGYRENDHLGGHDPYSASKAAAEIAISSYQRSFFPTDKLNEHGVMIATVRAGNVIGGGDWAQDRLIPDAAKALSSGDSVKVRNPLSVRPWQHVLEPLSGYLMLADTMAKTKSPEYCSSWNFGPLPDDERPVCELMDIFCPYWADGTWESLNESRPPHESAVLRLSIDKAVHELGWKPRWQLGQAVRRTALWYKEYYESSTECMRDTCYSDIEEFTRSGEHSLD